MTRAAAAVLMAAVVLAGVWVTGGLLTEDATAAMLLTGAWFAAAGLGAFVIARSRRSLAVPVLASWLVTSAAVGGFLLWTSTVDKVVDEDVVTAPGRSGSDGDTTATTDPQMERQAGERPGPEVVGTGRFRDGAHPTEGLATVIAQADGSQVLTLTRFETDPGPDLRVYLVPGSGSSVKNAVDLGALKGNKGNQQYAVPADSPDGAVVIWCRAFSVAFGAARLA
jgi:hypothetical protein